jgi:hypothetical protein
VFLYNFFDLERTRWEGSEALTPGKHTLEFDFKYDGLGAGTLAFNNVSGIGRGGTGVLKVDGKEIATQKMHTQADTHDRPAATLAGGHCQAEGGAARQTNRPNSGPGGRACSGPNVVVNWVLRTGQRPALPDRAA